MNYRRGDVYTYYLDNNIDTRVRACKRPFIIIDVEKDFVKAVPLTTNVSGIKDEKRVYSKLTVNGNTKDICILADVPIRIQKDKLIKKIAFVDLKLTEDIIEKSKNVTSYESGKTVQKHKNRDEINIVDEQEMWNTLQKINQTVKNMNSSKSKWIEREFHFCWE